MSNKCFQGLLVHRFSPESSSHLQCYTGTCTDNDLEYMWSHTFEIGWAMRVRHVTCWCTESFCVPNLLDLVWLWLHILSRRYLSNAFNLFVNFAILNYPCTCVCVSWFAHYVTALLSLLRRLYIFGSPHTTLKTPGAPERTLDLIEAVPIIQSGGCSCRSTCDQYDDEHSTHIVL